MLLCSSRCGWIQCLNVFFVSAAVVAATTGDADAEQRDDLNCDRHSNPVLARCLDAGTHFINNYIKSLRNDKHFDVCGRYAQFHQCITPFVAQCKHGSPSGVLSSDWRHVIHLLDAVCIRKQPDSINTLACFEDEAGGPLSLHCDEYYKFNIQQQTRNECFFLEEKLRCKSALMTSACDDVVGNFTHHLFRLASERLIERHRCTSYHNHTFNVFRYSETGCGKGFLEEIDQCTNRHLTEQNVLAFHSENDLVSLGSEHHIRETCKVYRRFRRCLQPVSVSCSHGVELLLQHETNLRRYTLKMDHICVERTLDVYAQSAACYQRVADQSALSQCDVYWADLAPWLANTTAVQYFCMSSHPNTVHLTAELEKSRACHSLVFTQQCGANASGVMTSLIERAFKDPLYLRLGYTPDCQLHGLDGPQRDTDVTARTHRSRPTNGHRVTQVLPVTSTSGDVQDGAPAHARHVISADDELRSSGDICRITLHYVMIATIFAVLCGLCC